MSWQFGGRSGQQQTGGENFGVRPEGAHKGQIIFWRKIEFSCKGQRGHFGDKTEVTNQIPEEGLVLLLDSKAWNCYGSCPHQTRPRSCSGLLFASEVLAACSTLSEHAVLKNVFTFNVLIKISCQYAYKNLRRKYSHSTKAVAFEGRRDHDLLWVVLDKNLLTVVVGQGRGEPRLRDRGAVPNAGCPQTPLTPRGWHLGSDCLLLPVWD